MEDAGEISTDSLPVATGGPSRTSRWGKWAVSSFLGRLCFPGNGGVSGMQPVSLGKLQGAPRRGAGNSLMGVRGLFF